MDIKDVEVLRELKKADAYAGVTSQLNCYASNGTLFHGLVPMPEGVTLESVEDNLPSRIRMRGVMTTPSLSSFVNFCADRAVINKSACFVYPASMSATAIFNIGTNEQPGHADHQARLALEKTAPFSALMAIAGPNSVPLNQTAIAEFIEDWRLFLTAFVCEGKKQSILETINAVRNIDITATKQLGSAVGDLNQSKSLLEKISAEGKAFALPSELLFCCAPYQGLRERELSLRLSVITTGDKVMMRLRVRNFEAVAQDMADELCSMISDRITTMPVYVGAYNKDGK